MENDLRPNPADEILDSLPDAVFALDREGRFTYANAQAEGALGRLREELVGRSVWDEFPGLAGTEFGSQLRRALEARAPAAFEAVYPPRDAWVQARVFPHGDGAAVALRDLEDRRRLEQERALLRKEIEEARRRAGEVARMKDEFLSMLSHELRTPLGAVIGWVQLLRDGRLDAEQRRRALDVIERNARAQAQLVKDLLDISRIAKGKVRFEGRPVDLGAVVGSAVEALALAAEAKGVAVDVGPLPAATVVLGEPDRLHQLVWCVLSNAVKFTPEGGRVTVRVRRGGRGVEVEVRDTGPGIGAEFLPRVFDRFSQEDMTLAREHRGLGLGLATAKGLAELHGGEVRAESPGPGLGSTFTISLPVQTAGEAASRHASAARDAALVARLEGLRVLVADDDPDACELMAAVLSQRGAEVRACGSARVALEAVQAWRPDVLLADLGMPDASGYDLVRMVRALPPERGGTTPAAAVTALVGPQERVRVLAAGFQAHVPKPVDPDEIVAIVASLAERSLGAGA